MTATNLAALMLIVLAKLGFSYYNVPAPCAMLVVVAGLSWPLPLTPKSAGSFAFADPFSFMKVASQPLTGRCSREQQTSG